MDDDVKRVNQNTNLISALEEQLDQAHAKIEDLQNRPRRCNFRVWGLPETLTDLEPALDALMQDLIPDISPHLLELDHFHWALTAPRSN